MSAVRFRNILACGCSAIGLMAGTAAYAQDTGQVEEVTVTAQRRVENVQKVPISIAAITPEAALNAGVLKTDQLAETVPGMQMSHEINSATTFIRGIGPNSNGTGEESSVAVYLDDLYIEQGDAAIFQLNGISGIDVLKGPQGTLFGRNATGGVVQVRTKDPEFDPSADINVGFANYATTSGDFYATGGLTDNLAANVALYGTHQADGWGHDVVTGAKTFTENDWGARTKFLWNPTSSTTVLLSGGHFYTRGEVGAGFNQVPGFVAAGGQGYFPGENGVDGAPINPAHPFQCVAPGACPPGATYVGFYNTQDVKNDVAVNKHDYIELKATQDLNFAKLVSISGFQRMDGYVDFDQDGSPYGDAVTKLNQTGRDLSQELQLLNPDNASYASWLSWIVGGFYLHDMSGYSHAQLRGTSFGFPYGLVPPNYYLSLTDNVTTESYAAYAQATAEIFDDTHLTVGGRYTHDKREFSGGLSLPPVLGGGALTHTSPSDMGATSTYPMTTYRVALDHSFTDDILTYVSYNRGVKSGQYDTFGTAAAGPIANPPVHPEVLKSLEAGLKSEWLDHRLRVNVSAFHYDASNLQIAIIQGGGTKLINAASAKVNGGELDVTAVPIENLTLTGGLSLLYGHYGSFKNAPAYFPPNSYYDGSNYSNCPPVAGQALTCDASGKDLVHAPHISGNFGADYTIPSSIGDFDLNANLSYTDKFFFFADQSLSQPTTTLYNASVMWTDSSGKFDIRLWGNNLSGAKYYSFGSESVGYGQQFSPEAPRTFGITLGAHI